MLAATAIAFQVRNRKSLIVLGSDLAWGAAGFQGGCQDQGILTRWLPVHTPQIWGSFSKEGGLQGQNHL